MSIESDLKKDGITVIEPLDTTTVNVIAKNVSKKIVAAFSNLGFDFDTLYERFSKLPMYIADIPEGMSEASYFYKNSAIYFRDGMGLADLEKFAVHELIHNFQEQKNEKGDLTRLGLCTFIKWLMLLVKKSCLKVLLIVMTILKINLQLYVEKMCIIRFQIILIKF